MAIPHVNAFSEMLGGAIPNVLNAHNTFANNQHLRNINAIKEQYMPITTQAEAASKLAYANLLGPQFVAKILGNENLLAGMGDPNAKAALSHVLNAGMGQGTGLNFLNQIPQGQTGIGGKLINSLSNFLNNKLKNTFEGNQSSL